MEQKKIKELTCNKCGWVHFAVSREFAENEVKTFNEYFNTLTEDKQQQYDGGKCSSIKQYENCFFCGNNYTNFREFQEGDCPDGVTLGPIIDEDYDDNNTDT